MGFTSHRLVHLEQGISPALPSEKEPEPECLLLQLVTGYSTNSTFKNYVDRATWYIVPVLNPDGYAYTHGAVSANSPSFDQGEAESVHFQDRMWRKNRRPKSSTWGCEGVDLNRNFEYGFGGTIIPLVWEVVRTTAIVFQVPAPALTLAMTPTAENRPSRNQNHKLFATTSLATRT